MKRFLSMTILSLMLAAMMVPTALAAETATVCYPTSITRNEDGTEIRKVYDLAPEEDPAGIPRSDFEQDGSHYRLVDLLKQELPENESRQHTETVSLESKSKDMESVLALLPQEREFITDDGLMGTLTLQLDTVRVEPSGYASSTKEVSATRSYPNLAGQDTQYIPKTIQDDGRTLTLSDVQWQTDNTASMDGYVKGYTVTADYTGTVSHIALDRVRYVAIYEGEPVKALVTEEGAAFQFQWKYVVIPVAFLMLVGGGIGTALIYRRKKEEA